MNYLSQLAARTLNQLPSLQPRLPSRFEAPRHETPVEAPAPVEYATFTASAPSMAMRAAAPTPTPIALETPRVVPADAPATHAVAPTLRPTLEPTPVNTTLVYQVETGRAVESDRDAPISPPTVIEHTIMTHVIEHDSPTIISNLNTAEQTTIVEQPTLIERERVLAPTLLAPVEARAHAPRVASRVTPYVPPAPESVLMPEPAPVVHVSIGRIEVRAVHAPAPSAPPPKSTPSPSLSLDDYLRGVRR